MSISSHHKDPIDDVEVDTQEADPSAEVVGDEFPHVCTHKLVDEQASRHTEAKESKKGAGGPQAHGDKSIGQDAKQSKRNGNRMTDVSPSSSFNAEEGEGIVPLTPTRPLFNQVVGKDSQGHDIVRRGGGVFVKPGVSDTPTQRSAGTSTGSLHGKPSPPIGPISDLGPSASTSRILVPRSKVKTQTIGVQVDLDNEQFDQPPIPESRQESPFASVNLAAPTPRSVKQEFEDESRWEGEGGASYGSPCAAIRQRHPKRQADFSATPARPTEPATRDQPSKPATFQRPEPVETQNIPRDDTEAVVMSPEEGLKFDGMGEPSTTSEQRGDAASQARNNLSVEDLRIDPGLSRGTTPATSSGGQSSVDLKLGSGLPEHVPESTQHERPPLTAPAGHSQTLPSDVRQRTGQVQGSNQVGLRPSAMQAEEMRQNAHTPVQESDSLASTPSVETLIAPMPSVADNSDLTTASSFSLADANGMSPNLNNLQGKDFTHTQQADLGAHSQPPPAVHRALTFSGAGPQPLDTSRSAVDLNAEVTTSNEPVITAPKSLSQVSVAGSNTACHEASAAAAEAEATTFPQERTNGTTVHTEPFNRSPMLNVTEPLSAPASAQSYARSESAREDRGVSKHILPPTTHGAHEIPPAPQSSKSQRTQLDPLELPKHSEGIATVPHDAATLKQLPPLAPTQSSSGGARLPSPRVVASASPRGGSGPRLGGIASGGAAMQPQAQPSPRAKPEVGARARALKNLGPHLLPSAQQMKLKVLQSHLDSHQPQAENDTAQGGTKKGLLTPRTAAWLKAQTFGFNLPEPPSLKPQQDEAQQPQQQQQHQSDQSFPEQTENVSAAGPVHPLADDKPKSAPLESAGGDDIGEIQPEISYDEGSEHSQPNVPRTMSAPPPRLDSSTQAAFPSHSEASDIGQGHTQYDSLPHKEGRGADADHAQLHCVRHPPGTEVDHGTKWGPARSEHGSSREENEGELGEDEVGEMDRHRQAREHLRGHRAKSCAGPSGFHVGSQSEGHAPVTQSTLPSESKASGLTDADDAPKPQVADSDKKKLPGESEQKHHDTKKGGWLAKITSLFSGDEDEGDQSEGSNEADVLDAIAEQAEDQQLSPDAKKQTSEGIKDAHESATQGALQGADNSADKSRDSEADKKEEPSFGEKLTNWIGQLSHAFSEDEDESSSANTEHTIQPESNEPIPSSDAASKAAPSASHEHSDASSATSTPGNALDKSEGSAKNSRPSDAKIGSNDAKASSSDAKPGSSDEAKKENKLKADKNAQATPELSEDGQSSEAQESKLGDDEQAQPKTSDSDAGSQSSASKSESIGQKLTAWLASLGGVEESENEEETPDASAKIETSQANDDRSEDPGEHIDEHAGEATAPPQSRIAAKKAQNRGNPLGKPLAESPTHGYNPLHSIGRPMTDEKASVSASSSESASSSSSSTPDDSIDQNPQDVLSGDVENSNQKEASKEETSGTLTRLGEQAGKWIAHLTGWDEADEEEQPEQSQNNSADETSQSKPQGLNDAKAVSSSEGGVEPTDKTPQGASDPSTRDQTLQASSSKPTASKSPEAEPPINSDLNQDEPNAKSSQGDAATAENPKSSQYATTSQNAEEANKQPDLSTPNEESGQHMESNQSPQTEVAQADKTPSRPQGSVSSKHTGAPANHTKKEPLDGIQEVENEDDDTTQSHKQDASSSSQAQLGAQSAIPHVDTLVQRRLAYEAEHPGSAHVHKEKEKIEAERIAKWREANTSKESKTNKDDTKPTNDAEKDDMPSLQKPIDTTKPGWASKVFGTLFGKVYSRDPQDYHLEKWKQNHQHDDNKMSDKQSTEQSVDLLPEEKASRRCAHSAEEDETGETSGPFDGVLRVISKTAQTIASSLDIESSTRKFYDEEIYNDRDQPLSIERHAALAIKSTPEAKDSKPEQGSEPSDETQLSDSRSEGSSEAQGVDNENMQEDQTQHASHDQQATSPEKSGVVQKAFERLYAGEETHLVARTNQSEASEALTDSADTDSSQDKSHDEPESAQKALPASESAPTARKMMTAEQRAEKMGDESHSEEESQPSESHQQKQQKQQQQQSQENSKLSQQEGVTEGERNNEVRDESKSGQIHA